MSISHPPNPNPFSDPPNPTHTEQLVASAIAGVIGAAKANGRSLQDVTEEVLSDDQVLDQSTRHWLSNVVSQAWEMPILESHQEAA